MKMNKAPQRQMHSSCGVEWSSPLAPAVLLALGVKASDAGVDLGSLVLVDPPGGYPFRQTVGVHPAGPAFLQKVGVVISAEQAQIV
jgi:hypothetical protein